MTFVLIIFILKIFLSVFIYLWLCWVFVAARDAGLLSSRGHRLLTAVTSLVGSPGSRGSGLQEWRLPGSVLVLRGLSCS